jgi:hypothetical protein
MGLGGEKRKRRARTRDRERGKTRVEVDEREKNRLAPPSRLFLNHFISSRRSLLSASPSPSSLLLYFFFPFESAMMTSMTLRMSSTR